MARRVALVLFVALLVSPAIRSRDSFPLSTYPMYAADRGRIASLSTVIGRTDVGDEVIRLTPQLIARTDDPLIAESSVRSAISGGRAAQWCATVAGRVTRSKLDRLRPVTRVEVVRERVDVVAFARSDVSVGDLTTVAGCVVQR
jgi:hypothetical protein